MKMKQLSLLILVLFFSVPVILAQGYLMTYPMDLNSHGTSSSDAD